MKKRVGLYILGMISVITLICCMKGFVFDNKEETKEETLADNILLEVGCVADFSIECDSVEQLVENSDFCVQGTITNRESFCDESATVYTDYTVEVVESYNDDIKKGDVIKITDLGGVISADKYFESQTDPKFDSLRNKAEKKSSYEVVYTLNGTTLPEVGQSYVWFLEDNSSDGKVCYNPVNCYQGVFEIDDEKAERISTEEDTPDYVNEIAIEELEEDISVYRRNK